MSLLTTSCFPLGLNAYVNGLVATGQVGHTGQNFLLRLHKRLRGLNDPRHAMHEAVSMLGAHLEADRIH